MFRKIGLLSDLKDVRGFPPDRVLEPDEAERLRALWGRIKDVDHSPTFEQFESDFARDRTPYLELEVYERIADTLPFEEQFPARKQFRDRPDPHVLEYLAAFHQPELLEL